MGLVKDIKDKVFHIKIPKWTNEVTHIGTVAEDGFNKLNFRGSGYFENLDNLEELTKSMKSELKDKLNTSSKANSELVGKTSTGITTSIFFVKSIMDATAVRYKRNVKQINNKIKDDKLKKKWLKFVNDMNDKMNSFDKKALKILEHAKHTAGKETYNNLVDWS